MKKRQQEFLESMRRWRSDSGLKNPGNHIRFASSALAAPLASRCRQCSPDVVPLCWVGMVLLPKPSLLLSMSLPNISQTHFK
jgi:hypothetical protein